jgi:hypothetical protein
VEIKFDLSIAAKDPTVDVSCDTEIYPILPSPIIVEVTRFDA